MKNTIFRGMGTAIVTPMNPDLTVDYVALGRFIDFQLENGINAIIAVGTTGESATLEPAEQEQVIRFTVERVNKRVPVIAGVGTNNTAHVLENVKRACDAGADGLLVVTPYYNKATQKGLIASYNAVADASDKPIIVYNVPSRTGCNIAPATVAALAEHPNIVAIKEASGDMGYACKVSRLLGDDFNMYCGNDDITFSCHHQSFLLVSNLT